MKYYLHNSNSFQDEKITKLFIEFGYEGLGLFYTILEKFALSECPIDKNVLKYQLKIGKRLLKIWDYLHEIELIYTKDNETFNENLLKFSEKYQIKKEKTRKRVQQFRDKQPDKKNVTCYKQQGNTSKVNIKDNTKDNINIDDKEPSLHSQLKNLFLEYYINETGAEFYWTAKEAKNLNLLINKIKKIAPESEPCEILKIMLSKIESVDKWIYDNLSISLINSKFNEIINKIKNNKTKGKQDYSNLKEKIKKDLAND